MLEDNCLAFDVVIGTMLQDNWVTHILFRYKVYRKELGLNPYRRIHETPHKYGGKSISKSEKVCKEIEKVIRKA